MTTNQVGSTLVRAIPNNAFGHGRGDARESLERLSGRAVDVDGIVLGIVAKTIANAEGRAFDVVGNRAGDGSRGAPDKILAPRAGGAAEEKDGHSDDESKRRLHRSILCLRRKLTLAIRDVD